MYSDSVILVNKGTRWIEPGYYAYDQIDGDLTEKVIVDSLAIVENIDSLGTYPVTYTVTNSHEVTTQHVRFVQVAFILDDRDPPDITLQGKNPDTVKIGSLKEYVDSGALAFDLKDGDLTEEIVQTGTVDLSTAGTYKISCLSIDSSGNKAVEVIKVVVIADTTDPDLHRKFGVPAEERLTGISNRIFTDYAVFGAAPDLSDITRIKFHWNPIDSAIVFSIIFRNAPYYIDLSLMPQTFISPEPSMTLVGISVAGLDGEYFITVTDEGWFVWVEKEGTFAIVWKE